VRDCNIIQLNFYGMNKNSMAGTNRPKLFRPVWPLNLFYSSHLHHNMVESIVRNKCRIFSHKNVWNLWKWSVVFFSLALNFILSLMSQKKILCRTDIHIFWFFFRLFFIALQFHLSSSRQSLVLVFFVIFSIFDTR
jgi:hypothetical protein